MSVVLHLPVKVYKELRAHLFSQTGEAAAFIYASTRSSKTGSHLDFMELDQIQAKERQGSTYGIDLTDAAQSRILAKAARLGASLVEIHSHPFTGRGAMFSSFDLHGLKEFVPHIWWRLRGGPYVALVFGRKDFDALAWLESPDEITECTVALDNGTELRPTGRTARHLQQPRRQEWTRRNTFGK